MNTRTSSQSTLRRFTIAAAVAILALVLSTPVLAGHKHHRHHHGGHGHGHSRGKVVYYAPRPQVYVRPVVIPTVIRPAYIESYRPYHRGYVHYAPHGHAHALYTFPVYHDHVLVHESRQYCGGELFFADGAYGPQFSLRIAF